MCSCIKRVQHARQEGPSLPYLVAPTSVRVSKRASPKLLLVAQSILHEWGVIIDK